MAELVTLDGAMGEGGGQILRSAVALSLVTGTPVRIENIRAHRPKPGLGHQHLAAVRAAAQVSGAEVRGAAVGSTSLYFAPGPVRPGSYRFTIATAGSCTLLLQTVLPALMLADAPSELILEGGTHNPFAPPFDFLRQTFAPLLARMGPTVQLRLDRYGFYPAGGGRMQATIAPVARLSPLSLQARGPMRPPLARALVVQLNEDIAHRELRALASRFSWSREQLRIDASANAISPGNVLFVAIESEHLTEVFSAIGQRGVSAEQVAQRLADEVAAYVESDAPVGSHLADQLLIPLALAGGGVFRTVRPTLHTLTNIQVIEQFLPVRIPVAAVEKQIWEVRVESRGAI
ncbi:MAG TPA: RNA 3'-terminal phosphate cyclase [bacterium]|nr:RNA 3'-terminal phosphate cyclase [bacterium]